MSRLLSQNDTYEAQRAYWNSIADEYTGQTRISLDDIHYGPLIPGDRELQLFPDDVSKLRCLEIGCGAGQNSVVLAKRGAICTAVDLSPTLLEKARDIADFARVKVDFLLGLMEELPEQWTGFFDIVHSSHALPFSYDPAHAIREMARVLRPGGQLVISTAHPAFNGEWLELDGDSGFFQTSYFDGWRDERETQSGLAICHSLPISEVFSWFFAAGLEIRAVEEPRAVPMPILEKKGTLAVPYESDAWREYHEQLSNFPFTLIIKAEKIVRQNAGA